VAGRGPGSSDRRRGTQAAGVRKKKKKEKKEKKKKEKEKKKKEENLEKKRKMRKNSQKLEKILEINLGLKERARGLKMEYGHKVIAKEAKSVWVFCQISPPDWIR